MVSSGEAQSRYNPIFHRGLGYSLAGWEKLKRHISVKGGKRIPLGDTYADEETGLYYLRVDNLSNHCEIAGEFKWLRAETFKTLERYRVFPGDVLVSIAGTIGRVAVVDESSIAVPTILTENCAKLHPSDSLLPNYLMLLLASHPLQAQMERDYIQTTIPKLGLDRIRQLRIPPVPDKNRQHQTIEYWQCSLRDYRQTLKHADELLDSIDDYLLAELGINLPSEPENIIASRIFTAQRRELAGWRFDPYYYGDKFHALENALNNSPYVAVSLAQLYFSINNGIDCREFIESGLPYAKVADIKPFAIDLNQAQKVPFKAVPDRGLVRKGDLLLTRKGTFGVAALVDTDEKFAISSEVFRIEVDGTNVLGSYLVAMLNSSVCQKQFDRQKIGAIMGSLTQVSLRRIRLPLPPLVKQQEILTVVDRIRMEASLLRGKAEIELESAKRQIEVMLFGGTA